MKIYTVLILFQIISFLRCVEKSDVIILKDENFDKYIKNNAYVLVKFYAPWCGHCKKLAPEYEIVASKLKEEGSQIKIAKVDCTVEQKVAKSYLNNIYQQQNSQNIESYPTIYFFIKGRPIQYNGGRTAQEIIDWLKQITSLSSNIINSIEQLNKFQSDNQQIVVYFGQSESQEKTKFSYFEKVSKKLGKKDKNFFYTFNSEIAKSKKIHILPAIIIYQGENYKKFNGSWNYEDIFKFIQDNLNQKIAIFDEITSQQIFLQQKPALILIYQNDYKNYQALNALEQVRSEINQFILVFKVNIIEQYGELLADLIGLQASETPKFIIIEKNDEILKKYWLNDQQIDLEILKQFVYDWKNNQLQESLKSQEIPQINDGPIKILVGNTYFNSIFNNDQDIFIMFYDSESKLCQDFSIIYEEIYSELANEQQQIIFYKIDGNKNEIPGLIVEQFPTLLMYNSNNKKNPQQYDKDLSKQSIIEFIKQNQNQNKIKKEL